MVDPELSRLVGERLRSVLADQVPRRASVPPAKTSDAPADEPDLPPRPVFTRAHVGVVAVLVVVGLLCTGWALLRARPVAEASPGSVTASTPQPGSPAASPGGSPTASTPAARIVVHVLGAVRRPGLVSLPGGSRVQEAIEKAGGLARSADPGELNLAQLLTDGEQIVIGTKGEPAGEVRGGGGGGGSTGGAGSSATLDLNRATQAQLEELPGVGPVTAGKIIAWRDEHRRFTRVEELQEVDGIGPKTYAQLEPHVRV
jgi:competence protein ComEA